jgi:hypothetical protein
MKSLTTVAAFGFAFLFASLGTAEPGSKTASNPLATGIARNQQELQELSAAVALNNADMRKIVGDVLVSLAGAVAGAGADSAFGQSPREAIADLISSYQKIQGALGTKDSAVNGDMWGAVSGQLKLTLDIIGETELPVRFANTLTDLVVRTAQLTALSHTNANLVAAEVQVARAQAYLLARAKEIGAPAAVPLDEAALKDIEDYLANFPIHLDPMAENPAPDGTAAGVANGAELDKALNENMARMMDPDNPRLPDFRIQTAPDDWKQWQDAFQNINQIAATFRPANTGHGVTPAMLAAMDAWVKGLAQLQNLMFQALAAAQNSPACKVIWPAGADIFDNDNPAHAGHYSNAAECNRLYAVFRGYNNSFMGSAPPTLASGAHAVAASSSPTASPRAHGASGTSTTNTSAVLKASSSKEARRSGVGRQQATLTQNPSNVSTKSPQADTRIIPQLKSGSIKPVSSEAAPIPNTSMRQPSENARRKALNIAGASPVPQRTKPVTGGPATKSPSRAVPTMAANPTKCCVPQTNKPLLVQKSQPVSTLRTAPLRTVTPAPAPRPVALPRPELMQGYAAPPIPRMEPIQMPRIEPMHAYTPTPMPRMEPVPVRVYAPLPPPPLSHIEFVQVHVTPSPTYSVPANASAPEYTAPGLVPTKVAPKPTAPPPVHHR